MAFTVGWPGASSPVSVAYADEYFADRGLPDWAGEDTSKQGALTRATDYVKALFAARFDPALFPVVDDVIVVPENLLKAISEYALIELKVPGSLAPASAYDASGYAVVTTKKKVGPIETNYSVVGGESAKMSGRRTFPVPDALIASLLLPDLGRNRVIR